MPAGFGRAAQLLVFTACLRPFGFLFPSFLLVCFGFNKLSRDHRLAHMCCFVLSGGVSSLPSPDPPSGHAIASDSRFVLLV